MITKKSNAIVCAGQFSGGEIEPGTFHGGEIEPGTFHHRDRLSDRTRNVRKQAKTGDEDSDAPDCDGPTDDIDSMSVPVDDAPTDVNGNIPL